MADHSTSMISIDGCRVQLMRGGSGAPMLFLHGGGGMGIWLPCMARLAKKFDVIAPEHPGFGESDTPEWLDTIGDLTNFYLEFLDRLDLRGVHLIGSSLGGWIAAELAVRNASRLASLTLVGAAGIYVEDVPQVDPFLNTEEQRLRDLFYDQELAEAVVASSERSELQNAALKNLATTAKLAWQPRNHDPHLRKWLHRIKLPTLLERTARPGSRSRTGTTIRSRAPSSITSISIRWSLPTSSASTACASTSITRPPTA